MTVYADVLFLVNFSLDYVSLYITGRLMSRPMKALRLVAASALGALYAVAALFFDLPEPVYISVTLAVSGVMCICAFRLRVKADLLGAVVETVGAGVLLFAVGCALGGAMTAIYSLGAGYNDTPSSTGSVGIMAAVAAAATVAVAAGGRAASRRGGVRCASVTVTAEGRSVTLDALADSGNLLRDPISGRPALIISADAASPLLPPEICEAAVSADVAGAAGALPPELLRRVRLLPVSNVYGSGLLLGYRPDSVMVGSRDGKMRDREYDCIIVVSAARGGFGGFDAVLPAELS